MYPKIKILIFLASKCYFPSSLQKISRCRLSMMTLPRACWMFLSSSWLRDAGLCARLTSCGAEVCTHTEGRAGHSEQDEESALVEFTEKSAPSHRVVSVLWNISTVKQFEDTCLIIGYTAVYELIPHPLFIYLTTDALCVSFVEIFRASVFITLLFFLQTFEWKFPFF